MVKHKLMAEERPDLLKEWDYEKNDKLGLKPNMFTCTSHKKVWWKCNKFPHSYECSISNKVYGRGCSYCSGKKVLVGFNDFQTLYPNLVKEWDISLNNGKKPIDYTKGSHEVIVWKCLVCGHLWSAQIKTRVSGKGCPVCAGREVKIGYNDLKTLCPVLSLEWDYEVNGNKCPEHFTKGSNVKVGWKCLKCGHRWVDSICHRSLSMRGCPKCNSVYGTSFAEQSILFFVRKFYKGTVHNRYLFYDIFGSLEADIYIPKKKIVIEHNGSFFHKDKSVIDEVKLGRFSTFGLKSFVIVESDKNFVDNNIIFYNYHKKYYENLSWAIRKLFDLMGFSCKFIIDVDKYKNDIFLAFKTDISDSFGVEYPEIAKDWDYENNNGLTPYMFKSKSGFIASWICHSCGYKWKSSIVSRVGTPCKKGSGCRRCSAKKKKCGGGSCSSNIQRVFIGINDLASQRPDLLEEWDYELNGDNKPDMFSIGSKEKVWWKCNNYPHSYECSISNRFHGKGCSYCSGKKVLVGFNDFASLYPDIAKEWHYELNGDDKPDMFTAGSGKSFYWKCFDCGHIWKNSINHRAHGEGCPECAKNKRKKK